jgi:hypothetical protein
MVVERLSTAPEAAFVISLGGERFTTCWTLTDVRRDSYEVLRSGPASHLAWSRHSSLLTSSTPHRSILIAPLGTAHATDHFIGGAPLSNVSGSLSSASVLMRQAKALFLLELTAAPASWAIQYQNLSVRLKGDTKVYTLRPHRVGCLRPLLSHFAKGSRGPSQ